MTQEEQETNKTIIISYDDATRMKDFCCDDAGVTRDFMDWYVKEETFFTKTGTLIVENIFEDKTKKFTVQFDFNNPKSPDFIMWDYRKQKPLCKYKFLKEENFSMKDISVKIKWFDKKSFKNSEEIFSEHSIEKHKTLLDKRLSYKKPTPRKQLTPKQYHKAKHKLEEEAQKLYDDLVSYMSQCGVYYCYAVMYYYSKNKAIEVVGNSKTQLLEERFSTNVIGTYKYTGYVNLNDSKIYKPVIKKDPNEPTREYGRHIEKWSVRGHYRKTNGKIIWIEEHEKGEGTLENRIYGTEKESAVELTPKVFNVVRTVYTETPDLPPEVKSVVKEKIPILTTSRISQEKKPITFINRIQSVWTKIKSMFHVKTIQES